MEGMSERELLEHIVRALDQQNDHLCGWFREVNDKLVAVGERLDRIEERLDSELAMLAGTGTPDDV